MDQLARHGEEVQRTPRQARSEIDPEIGASRAKNKASINMEASQIFEEKRLRS